VGLGSNWRQKQCSLFVIVPKSFLKVQIGKFKILVCNIKLFLKCPFFSVFWVGIPAFPYAFLFEKKAPPPPPPYPLREKNCPAILVSCAQYFWVWEPTFRPKLERENPERIRHVNIQPGLFSAAPLPLFIHRTGKVANFVSLKVVSDEMNWGWRVYSNNRYWSGNVAQDSFYVHFSSHLVINVFPFPSTSREKVWAFSKKRIGERNLQCADPFSMALFCL